MESDDRCFLTFEQKRNMKKNSKNAIWGEKFEKPNEWNICHCWNKMLANEQNWINEEDKNSYQLITFYNEREQIHYTRRMESENW